MATTAKKPATRKTPPRATPARSKDGTFKKANASHWGTAAIVGGVAAVGAVATAALFALRGSSTLADVERTVLDKTGLAHEDDDRAGKHAHQADGSDSSASYRARIADEGTIPA